MNIGELMEAVKFYEWRHFLNHPREHITIDCLVYDSSKVKREIPNGKHSLYVGSFHVTDFELINNELLIIPKEAK